MADTAWQSWYEILGIPPQADADGIRNAYCREAMRWHPERYDEARRDEADERFRKIGAAYKTLSDPTLRAEYDAWLAAGRPASAAGSMGVRARKTLAFSVGLMEAEAARLFFEQMLTLSAELKRKGYRGRQRLSLLETLGCPASVVRAVGEYAQRKRRMRAENAQGSPNAPAGHAEYAETDLPGSVELAEWAQIKPYYMAVIGGEYADERMDEASYRKHMARFNRSLVGYALGFVLLFAGILMARNGPLGGWLALGGMAVVALTLVWRMFTGGGMAFHREKAMRHYLPAFKGFHTGQAVKRSRFNIGGFFGSVYWLGYRRMSRYAFIGAVALAILGWALFLVGMNTGPGPELFWLAIAVGIGLCADRIYFAHARRRIEKVLLYPRRQALAQLRESGGGSRLSCLGFIAFGIVLSLPLMLYQAGLKSRQEMFQARTLSTGQMITDHAARQKLAAEATARSAQIRKELLDAAIAETQARYPQLDPRNPRYDERLAERVSARMQNYIRQGADPARARRMAASEIVATGAAK